MVCSLHPSIRTNAAEFSRDFYDRYVFARDPIIGDLALEFANTNQRLISEADPAFAAVNLAKLNEELLGLRLEMIGTAWTHESKPEAALAISEFTKRYLADIHRSELWEVMTSYNQVVAQSATYGDDPKSRPGRARITFVNVMRANRFDDWANQGRESEAAARVANRIGSEVSWKAGITQGLLAIRLTRRLDFEGSDAIWERLAAVSYGFYRGAKEALEGVTLIA